MRALTLLLMVAALAVAGCAVPHEGDRYLVAGVLKVEGLAWKVRCGATTQAQLNARLRRSFVVIESTEAQDFDPRTDDGLLFVQAIHDHYWATRDLEACPQ